MELTASAVRLRAIVEADPGALVRVLQFFQARNIVPLHVTARRFEAGFLEIEIEITPDTSSSSIEALQRIVAKLGELPIVMTACISRVQRVDAPCS